MKQPVGQKVTSTNPLLGVLSTLEMMKLQALGKDVSGRSTAMTDEVGNITIDTCVPSDTNVWETGIIRPSVEGAWVIVGQYITDEEAREGHKQWVELMQREPTCQLKDINNWNIPDEKEVTT